MKRFLTPAASLILVLTALLLWGCGGDEPSETSKKETSRATPTTVPDNSDERFALKDISGTTRVWSEFAGKPLAINFWATWCGPCRMEIPVLKKLYAEYQPKGLEIIGISVDRDQRKVPPYVQQMGMPWVVLYTNREVLQEFKMGQGIPYTIFIDAEGNETGRVIGAQPEGVFRRELAKIFPEG